MGNEIKASDCVCVECGGVAEAFWPQELELPTFPYCQKCLNRTKLRLLIKIHKQQNENNRPKG